ncbi:MAG: hypothetical protein OXC42_02210 [Gammaproteobacteria bacterium]|nr:hypothetical protein [Gammaproteobacteria bacterium]
MINSDLTSHHLTEKWIREKQFLKYEKAQLLLGKKSRKRNRLYCFDYKPEGCCVVMKVSEISRHYKLGRKIDLFLTGLFKDYNYKSYMGSLRLQRAGVDTIKPIAYWTFRATWWNRKSYLLYQKVEGEITVTELCGYILQSDVANKDALIKSIAVRCADLVNEIHAANIRHDDPHGGNILTDLNRQNIDTLDVKDIATARFTLIDNDRCTFSRSPYKILKRFFDLKCLARFRVGEVPQKELLHLYLKDDYRTYWWHVLNFWNSGGFNIVKRINLLKSAK